MKSINKFLFLTSCILLLTATLNAQTAIKKNNIVNINAFIEDELGPLEGSKRVLLTLFDDSTKVNTWSEDHKDITFVGGSAVVRAGSQVALTATIIGDLTTPNIQFQIEGVENVFQFHLNAAPFAIDMPGLRDGTMELNVADITGKDVTLDSITFADDTLRPFHNKTELADGSTDLTLKDLTVDTITFDPSSDPYLLISDLTKEYKDSFAKYQALGIDTDGSNATGIIDNTWLTDPGGGGGGGGGGGLSKLEVRKEIQTMMEDTLAAGNQKGIAVNGVAGNNFLTDNSGNNIFLFDVDDPTITIDGAISGAATMTDLGDVTLTAAYAGILPVTLGGTNATDAANARTNLGAQAQNDNLDAISGLTIANGDFLVGNANTGLLTNISYPNMQAIFNIATNSTLTIDELIADEGTFNNVNSVKLNITSDKRIKKNIENLQNSLETILALQGKTYNFVQDSKYRFSPEKQFGFIAQEIEAILPELVSESSLQYQDQKLKTITPLGLIPVIVEAIKEQQTQINDLKTENQTLRDRLDAIEAKLGQ